MHFGLQSRRSGYLANDSQTVPGENSESDEKLMKEEIN